MLLLPEKDGFLDSLWLLGVVALSVGESSISASTCIELRGEASSASAMAGGERSPLADELVSGVERGVEVVASSSISAERGVEQGARSASCSWVSFRVRRGCCTI